MTVWDVCLWRENDRWRDDALDIYIHVIIVSSSLVWLFHFMNIFQHISSNQLSYSMSNRRVKKREIACSRTSFNDFIPIVVIVCNDEEEKMYTYGLCSDCSSGFAWNWFIVWNNQTIKRFQFRSIQFRIFPSSSSFSSSPHIFNVSAISYIDI